MAHEHTYLETMIQKIITFLSNQVKSGNYMGILSDTVSFLYNPT